MRDFVALVSPTEKWPVSAPAEVVRRLTEAFNGRDRDGFLGLLADDVEFRTPMGTAMHGLAAAKGVLAGKRGTGRARRAGRRTGVDGERVALPTIMRMADGTELRCAGVFEIRDGKVAVFCVMMTRADVGL